MVRGKPLGPPRRGLLLGLFAVGLGTVWLACGPKSFQDEALINGVRIMATRADRPYARPGDDVTLTVLADDGRSSRPEPMVVYWFPVNLPSSPTLPLPPSSFVCEDPLDDAYYACFSALLGDGGAPAEAGGRDAGKPAFSIGPGVDLSPFLPTGPTLTVPIPTDIVAKHAPVQGATIPYGVAIVFNMACAGHPELLPVDKSNLSFNQLPIGCFDKNHNQEDSSDYVVGYATVYAYDTVTNHNPVIAHVLFQGDAMTGDFLGDSSPGDAGTAGEGGIVVPACTSSDPDACAGYTFDIDVPDASWELDPQDIGTNGQPLHEQLWVDYYWTAGGFSDDSRLIFDPSVGYVGGTAVTMTAPSKATNATFWAVVHDNRGGVSWDVVPFRVQ